MGADAFTVYYGLRFPVRDDELNLLEGRAHPHQISARKVQHTVRATHPDERGGQEPD